MRMLKIKNWEKFQHYKDRSPPWIKLSTDTFQNYEFSRLHDASKLLAICIWTLASKSNDGSFHDDFTYIKRQSNLSDMVTEEHLKELIDHGFIVDASASLAECKQDARPETEERQRREEAEERHKNGFSSERKKHGSETKPTSGTEAIERILHKFDTTLEA